MARAYPFWKMLKKIDCININSQYAKSEPYWKRRLRDINPFVIEDPTSGVQTKQISNELKRENVELPQSLQEIAKNYWPELTPGEFLFALGCLFFQRISDTESFDIAVGDSRLAGSLDYELFTPRRPLRINTELEKGTKEVCPNIIENYVELNKRGLYTRDLIPRTPDLKHQSFPIAIDLYEDSSTDLNLLESSAALFIALDGKKCEWITNSNFTSGIDIADKFSRFIAAACENLEAPLSSISLLSGEEQQKILVKWNETDKVFAKDKCIHQIFEEQAAIRPNDVALCFRDQSVTYQELNEKSNIVAKRLQDSGVKPNDLVGIFIERSIEMVIALMGTLKAGGAYVPLDPEYPRERIALMIEDAKAPIILTSSNLASEVPQSDATTLAVDIELQNHSEERIDNLSSNVSPKDLAYVIYTSGSTGKPKGVMLEHRNVTNFFAGMDDTLEFQDDPGVWLAVTSISFDISVLEIFWTLARGFKVIIQEEEARTLGESQQTSSRNSRPLKFGLFYFSSDAGPETTDRYKLLKEGAKFADKNGFSSMWTPERHFHLFGGLYPNPSVTSAAIAAMTENVDIRSGSVVLPLHNPIRVAEEWSVVDNLSNGRVGLAFASGWNANDFTLKPENYKDRKKVMFESIDTMLKLWAGESKTVNSGEGKPFEAKIFPPPIQKRPPIWITTVGNVESFKMAGERGFNILTHLLGQDVDVLAKNLVAYRKSWKENGHKGEGIVSVMIHTFIGKDPEEVRKIVKEPFCNYLKTSFDLVKISPWAFPTFKQPSKAASQDPTFDPNSFTEEDMDALMGSRL